MSGRKEIDFSECGVLAFFVLFLPCHDKLLVSVAINSIRSIQMDIIILGKKFENESDPK